MLFMQISEKTNTYIGNMLMYLYFKSKLESGSAVIYSQQCLNELNVIITKRLFVCVEVLRPSQPNGVMSSAISLPNHTFTGQA